MMGKGVRAFTDKVKTVSAIFAAKVKHKFYPIEPCTLKCLALNYLANI